MSSMRSTFENEIEKYGYLVYTNVGNSMMPLIRNGKDILVITKKKESRLKKYDIVLYKRDNGQYVLHRILKVRRKDYILCGDNRCKKEKGVTDKQIIGILEKIIKDDIVINVHNRKYILFLHIWCDLFFIRIIIIRLSRGIRRTKRVLKYYAKRFQ